MKPKQLSKEQFLNLLESLAEAVRNDDSFGGSLEYEASEFQKFDVLASFRVGNSEGQGGMIVVGN